MRPLSSASLGRAGQDGDFCFSPEMPPLIIVANNSSASVRSFVVIGVLYVCRIWVDKRGAYLRTATQRTFSGCRMQPGSSLHLLRQQLHCPVHQGFPRSSSAHKLEYGLEIRIGGPVVDGITGELGTVCGSQKLWAQGIVGWRRTLWVSLSRSDRGSCQDLGERPTAVIRVPVMHSRR